MKNVRLFRRLNGIDIAERSEGAKWRFADTNCKLTTHRLQCHSVSCIVKTGRSCHVCNNAAAVSDLLADTQDYLANPLLYFEPVNNECWSLYIYYINIEIVLRMPYFRGVSLGYYLYTPWSWFVSKLLHFGTLYYLKIKWWIVSFRNT